MSTKRGRKCSLKTCTNYQHTHKHLSFFRFPKDIERCKVWIEKTRRFDLLSKANVHDERICQQHFEPTMFLNETQHRLQSYAIPTLYLTGAQPHISVPTMDDLRINGFPNDFSYNKNTDFNMEIANVAAKAAMLYQNNLTITPVFASQLDSIQLTPPKDRPISDLLTLKSLECINLSPPITPKANEKQLLSPSPNKSDTEQLDGSPVKSQKQNDGISGDHVKFSQCNKKRS